MQIADFRLQIVAVFAFVALAAAQESPPPTEPAQSPSPEASFAPTASASPAVTVPPTASPARSVRISFLPPPLEGTISLGVYDHSGKLVRVLAEEVQVGDLEIGADGLIVKWNGKSDHGEDMPSGKYHARGYLVGHLKVEGLGKSTSPPPDSNPSNRVQVSLVSNPLTKNARLVLDLVVDLADERIFLNTSDGLPLHTIEEAGLIRVSITKNGEKAVDIWADDGTAIKQLRVSNVDRMMAFDCGAFDLE